MNIITKLLFEFRWFRRTVGGTWYKVYDPSSAGGLESYITFWTQDIPEGDWIVEKKEEH